MSATLSEAHSEPQRERREARRSEKGYVRTVLGRLRHDYVTLFFLAIIVLLVLAAVFAPLLAPFEPERTNMAFRLKAVGFRSFHLGTDELGRDMLSRLIFGARVSLIVGLVPVTVATCIGGTLGILSGFLGGIVQTVIMRSMDVFYAFPSVLLAVAVSGTLGGGLANSVLALTLVFIPPLCRIADTASGQIRNLDFIEAARASGASTGSILVRHVLGNILPSVFVYASSLISVAILLGAGLSFLGLGVEPPTADWGLMLANLRQAIYVQPLVCALPGVAILLASLSFNLVSDGLRQAMDIRS